MRRFLLLLFLAVTVLVLAFAGKSTVDAQSNDAYGGRPPMFTPGPVEGMPVSETPVPASSAPPRAAASFPPVSLFGMNLYLTGRERSNTQAATLGQMAAAGGVKWSREELSWANLEPVSKGSFNWGPYDTRLAYDAGNGINVVGMLLTTPKWASTNPSAGNYYWYEPSNFNDYFDFVRAAVTRWKGQIRVWEIWNEPNAVGTWNCVNGCDRAADYARLLQGAYAAVKSVDPSARVLIGGLYVHDTTNEGVAFLNSVVAASGGAINFDGLSIHTYMPDRVPESMRSDSVVQNFQYRLNMVNDWIDAHGGRPGEIWITEDGRSTCVGCPSQYAWTEDEQASMLARMYGIAGATRRVAQFDYFQFEDKFNNPADLYGGMSVVRDDLSTKPAYAAYRTASAMLDGATFAGQGPQMVAGNNPNQPNNSDYIGFDYRFTKGDTSLHMVWRVNDSATVSYPVETAQVDIVDRDGGTRRVSSTNGAVQLTIGPKPQYVVSVGALSSCPVLFSDVPVGSPFYSYVRCLACQGIIGGYSDGTFGPNNSITRGQLSKIVSNASGFTETRTGQSFQDIAPDSPFYQFIERLSARSTIGGYTCGGPNEPCGAARLPYFRPNANTTRGQIAKIVAGAKGYSDAPAGQSFADVPPGSLFYTWVQQLASRSIMGGYTCGGAGEPCGAGSLPYFRPGFNATRGQVSKIVVNAFFPQCNVSRP